MMRLGTVAELVPELTTRVRVPGVAVSATSKVRVHEQVAAATKLSMVLGTLAVIAASTNMIGGFMITDRMLKMFKKRGGK